jgi:cytochrome c oxidase cbb3-type subunit I
MLLRTPVRGVLQPVVNAWYVHGLYGLWFTSVALAAIYYFLPKLLGKPIHSYYLAPIAFWWFVSCTALAGGSRLAGAPVPVWIPTFGIVASLALVLPLILFVLNFLGTLAGRWGAVGGSLSLRFIVFGLVGFLLSSLLGLALSLRDFAAIAQFTLLAGLRDWLTFYACFSTALFGAAYFFLPRVTGKQWRSSALVQAHFGATVVGVLLVIIGLGAGGWQQGGLLNHVTSATDAQGNVVHTFASFADITKALAGWHTLVTGGFAVLLIGHVAFLINFVWIACPINSQRTATAVINPPPALGLAAKEGHA